MWSKVRGTPRLWIWTHTGNSNVWCRWCKQGMVQQLTTAKPGNANVTTWLLARKNTSLLTFYPKVARTKITVSSLLLRQLQTSHSNRLTPGAL
jgi:hypothetical protein